MKKMIIVGAAGALLISACAAAGDLSTPDSDDDGATTLSGKVAQATDSSVAAQDVTQASDTSAAAQDEIPTESIPGDPKEASDYDASSSGLGEPGDTPPPADDTGSLVLGGDVPGAVATAMANLAAYLGVSVDAIDWVSYEEVDWPDGSLGCPQPDMSYKQVIVNGSLIVFEVDGASYEYHSGGSREPFLCLPGSTSKDAGSKDLGGSGGHELPTTTVDLNG
jgi:hypothetical protein